MFSVSVATAVLALDEPSVAELAPYLGDPDPGVRRTAAMRGDGGSKPVAGEAMREAALAGAWPPISGGCWARRWATRTWTCARPRCSP
ncbi:hypothetical protein MAHJHV63_50610 [Mycobacterium avium subsp. hominissuis]